jgi:hypothetical protein
MEAWHDAVVVRQPVARCGRSGQAAWARAGRGVCQPAAADRLLEMGECAMTLPSEEQIAEAQRIAQRRAENFFRGRVWEGIGPDDVVQDVMEKFVELDLTTVDNWEAWVTWTTGNRCVDIQRAKDRHRDLEKNEAAARVGVWAMGPSAGVMSK